MFQPKAALFDLDGVLIDTETTYTRIWDDIEKVFPTGIENFALKIKGTTLPDILSTYFPDQTTQEEVMVLLRKSEDEMTYPLFDGVMRLLGELREHGIPAAIVTSSGSEKMARIAAEQPEFIGMFDAVVSDADVTYSKPDPDPYLTGARKLEIKPCDCVVFEDSFAGMESGRRAGCKVIGIATTNPRESIVGKADYIADSIAELTVAMLYDL